jgi:hypothetical protein
MNVFQQKDCRMYLQVQTIHPLKDYQTLQKLQLLPLQPRASFFELSIGDIY